MRRESNMEGIIDFSDDYVNFTKPLYEAVSTIPKVLAKVSGPFFVPDGASRNKRWYSEAFWKSVLGKPEVIHGLKDGMLGTLIHPTDEKAAHPMYSSHVVKKLWINSEKQGLGEAYVLDTPIGRIIDTFSSSGLVNLYVSSRAYGSYKDEGRHEGMPVVDEENYVLKTFDFVLEPGFTVAFPSFSKTMEQLEECYCDTKYFDVNLSKLEKEIKVKRLIEDLNYVLQR